jgi:Uma2 family endonuclease
MIYTPNKLLSFDEFIIQYGDNPHYELADGELIDMEPTGSHQTVGGKLATKISSAIGQTFISLVYSSYLFNSICY